VIKSLTNEGDIDEEIQKEQSKVDIWNKTLDKKFPKLKPV
jgi:hypothetical protein